MGSVVWSSMFQDLEWRETAGQWYTVQLCSPRSIITRGNSALISRVRFSCSMFQDLFQGQSTENTGGLCKDMWEGT